MSDDEGMGSLFKARADASKVKRAMNRESSAQALTEAGVQFVSKNGGAHLIIGDEWEFWPGTGLFKHRHLPITGRGVHRLIAAIQQGAKP